MENICMCCGLLFCWGLPSQAYAGSAPGEPRPRNSNEGGSRRSAAPWRLLRSVKFGRPSPSLCSGCLSARAAGEWRREAAALLENTPLVVGQARRRDAHWHPGESRWQGASPLLCPPVRCRTLILLRFPSSSLHSRVLLRDELPQVGRSAIPPDPVSALRVSKCPAYIPRQPGPHTLAG